MAKKKTQIPMALAAALLALAGTAKAQETLDAGALTPLSAGADLCHDPAIAASPNGTVAAWSALVDGRNRIQAAFRGTQWTAPYIADISATADCAEPVVAWPPAGNYALAWVEAEEDEHRLVYGLAQEDPAAVYTTDDGIIETPSLAFDSEGQPLIAWTEGTGASYSVALATRDADDAAWQKIPLTMRPDAYDILPTVFGGQRPTVHWYTLDGQAFRMKSALVEQRGWRSVSSGELADLPANRLPILYETAPGRDPGAIWVEPQNDGEILLTYDPRRAATERIQRLDNEPAARQLEPDAADRRAVPAYAWREETSESNDLLVQMGAERHRLTGLAHIAQPRLAADPAGGLHLLCISDQVEGGTGQVYWTLLD